jgi:elongation factor Ts
MQGAIEWLRKKGLSKAAKVASKIAAEGAVGFKASDDLRRAAVVEVNCQTDFVAQNTNFITIVQDMTNHIFSNKIADVEALKVSTLNGLSFEESIAAAIQKVGENIQVRRFENVSVSSNGILNGYVHSNGSIGVVVAVEASSADVANGLADTVRDIAMHAAAMNPSYLNEDDIPAETIAKETEIAKEELKKEGKPEAMWDKILPGKIKRFAKENALTSQMYVKDDKKTVAEALSAKAKELGGTATISSFVRYKVGDGIAKEEVSFADEVAAQMASAKK